MSLFRKPKKIQRRMFCADDDEDGDPEPPPPPVISHNKKENKPVKSTTLLSFADEEEETEVFKVKKSSQSKRLAKRRDKEKRRVPDGDNNKYDNHNDDVILEQPGEDNEKDKPEKPKKKVSLEGLILSGRAALAAGAGDVSDSGGEEGAGEEEEEDSRGFHRYRAESVRAALAGAHPGHIPDAALIHAARKTRQQARELGDFVPLHSENAPGSRLIRDDDVDDDDDEDGRIQVRGLELPSDKPKRCTAAAASDEEINSEAEEWEEQQMQKAMPSLADITGNGIELNPFAVAPPPPQLGDTPAHLRSLNAPGDPPPQTAQELVDALQNRLIELQTDRQATMNKRESCKERLLNAARTRESRKARCGELDAAYRRAQAARGYITDLIECLDEKMPELETLESRALALHRRRCDFLVERRRADVRDQAQDVLALAARAGAAKPVDSEEKRQRAAEREGRRRARRLKREGAGTASAHRDGDSSDDELPPAQTHHAQQETEAIRALSGRLFADALTAWRDVRGVCARMARLRRRQPALYNDAYVAECLPKLLAPYVRHQLILWNPLADEDNEDYEKMDWYKCLMMYGVRSEKIASDSDDSSSESEESGTPPRVTEESVREDPDLMLVPTIIDKVVLPKVTDKKKGQIFATSYKSKTASDLKDSSSKSEDSCVSLRVTEEAVRENPDLILVPTIVDKVLLPKVTEIVEHAWDPMSVRACVRLRQLLVRACELPVNNALARLATAARARLAQALNADVFLPALPPQLLEGPGGAFWRRCLGSGVRLLRAALALSAPPPALNANSLVLSLIETLCCAAGAAPGPQMAGAVSALADTLPRAGELRARALRRLAALAQLALTRLHSDNPMHLKALEQARGVLAEAKAVE